MKPPRTFKLERLYHQFLQPKKMPDWLVDRLAEKLCSAGFIHYEGDGDRYSETEKLLSREHRDELFKLIEGLK
jgi:hypothetical protein